MVGLVAVGLGLVAYALWFAVAPMLPPESRYQVTLLQGDRLRRLPSGNAFADEVRAPIAWNLATGDGVTAAILLAAGAQDGVTEVDDGPFVAVAPGASLVTPLLGGLSPEAAAQALLAARARLAVVPDPLSFESRWLEVTVRAVVHSGVAVVVEAPADRMLGSPSTRGSKADTIAFVQRLREAGAIVAAGYGFGGEVQGEIPSSPAVDVHTLEGNPGSSALVVAAVGALVLERDPALSPAALRERLVTSAVPAWQLTDPVTRRTMFRWVDAEGRVLPRRTYFRAPLMYHQLDAPRALGVELRQPWFLEAIGAPAAHEVASGSGMTIAVIDFGFHEESSVLKTHLAGKQVFGPGRFEEQRHPHGTLMAETALAVAPEARILALAAPSAGDEARWGARVAEAVRFATKQGAHVISMSLAPIDSPELLQAIDEAIAAGTSVVWINYGGSNPAVIRPEPLGEPGGDLYVLRGDGLFPAAPAEMRRGRSDAAPQVAGAVALLRQIRPAWGPAEVKAHLVATARPIGATGRSGRAPAGQGQVLFLDLPGALGISTGPLPEP